MNLALEILSLVIVGSVAGAELGSWYCVQPVVSQLAYASYVAMEKGMLRTFGRAMPILMPLGAVLTGALTAVSGDERNVVLWLRFAATLCMAGAVVTTLFVIVPINSRTAHWQLTENRDEWERMRLRWRRFQGVRSALFMLAFVLLTIAAVVGHG